MSVPAIGFYASPSSSIMTSHHSCHVVASSSSSSSLDFGDVAAVSSRPSSSSSSISRSTPGGLSLMFSSSSSSTPSHPIKNSSSIPLPSSGEPDDLTTTASSSYSYSPFPSKRGTHSPVSVLQHHHSSFPYYGCGGGGGSIGGSSRSDLKSSAGRDRLLRRFVTNALGSYLDYDHPPALDGFGHTTIGLDDLSFVAVEEEESSSFSASEPYAREMLSVAQSRHAVFKKEFVVRAFYEAERAHRGQMRASGDHYLQHCVETALLLAEVGAGANVVAAGLLHDTLDDSFVDHAYISREFGSAVANLVKGVSKLSHLSKLARDNNTACETAEADKLHTMFLAMADARAVLIKLADRLHNMMTLDALPEIKRRRFAKETLEIFAPLANRLGIFSWKEQLENLSFKHLNPIQHDYLSSILLKTFDEAMIASAEDEIGQALEKEGLAYHALYGRHKSLYSIYSKMQKKNLSMNEIHDIHGLRLVVENGEDCYKALDVVHRLWPKVAGRYKDYLKKPKENGYQSLHTVVLSKGGVPLEVQIRTKEMHLQAEFGFAAHWRYKESGCAHSSFILQMVEWARWVLTWHCETMSKDRAFSLTDRDPVCYPCSFPCHSDSCPFSYHPMGVHDRPVFVILLENDKMSVQEMKPDSTLMDLFERISWGSSRWGARSYPTKEEMVRAKLNHEQVADPKKKLKMGDVVELPCKSLTEYREEIKRMYNGGLAVSIRK